MKNENSQLEVSLDFYIYNIVFSQKSGNFTKSLILNELDKNDICYEEYEVIRILSEWIDDGLIFDNITNYVINELII